MLSTSHTLSVKSSRRTHLLNITADVQKLVSASGISSGVCYLFTPHTTAGLTINEGDDPDVARDLESALDRLIPLSASYKHYEGNSDSHIKSSLVGVSLTLFIENSRLALGRWQSIFFCEFDGPRSREVRVKLLSD